MSPSSWATACWRISAGRRRTRTRPSARSGPGWRSRQRSDSLSNPAGEALAARVAIATGLVVVGDLVGEGAAQEQAVVGDTPEPCGAPARDRGARPGGDRRRDAAAARDGLRARGSGRARAQGHQRAGRGVRGHRRAVDRQPLRGEERSGAVADGRARPGAGAAARALGAGEGRRGPGCPAGGRGRDRQIAAHPGAARCAGRGAAHAHPLPVLALSCRQRAVAGDPAAEPRGRARVPKIRATSRLDKLEALLARAGDARRRAADREPARARRRGAATAPSTSPRRPSGRGRSMRWSLSCWRSRGSSRPRRARGCPLGRPHHARADRAMPRPDRRRARAAPADQPPRSPARPRRPSPLTRLTLNRLGRAGVEAIVDAPRRRTSADRDDRCHHRAHRRCAAVRRGVDQGGAGDRRDRHPGVAARSR